MKRAIVLCDLLTLYKKQPIARYLLDPILCAETVDYMRHKFAGIAMPVRDDVSDKRWQAIIQIIRDVRQIGKWEFRMLENNGKGWRIV